MTDIRGRWVDPVSHNIDGLAGGQIHTFIPKDRPDMLRIEVGEGSHWGRATITREQARALVDAINELGDRMGTAAIRTRSFTTICCQGCGASYEAEGDMAEAVPRFMYRGWTFRERVLCPECGKDQEADP